MLWRSTASATAMRRDSRLQVVGLGPRPEAALPEGMDWIETPDCEADIAAAMEKALDSGDLEGAVALHYPFPVGVTTMGRVFTPARGKPMILASSTGISAPQRACAMLRNAVYGLAVAKAMGIAEPTLGVLNLDAAPQVMRALSRMAEKGYALRFGQSVRKDGGALLRGFADMGSPIAVSDAAVGAALALAALRGAEINVRVNTRLMQDRERAAALDAKAHALVDKYARQAEKIYNDVYGRLAR